MRASILRRARRAASYALLCAAASLWLPGMAVADAPDLGAVDGTVTTADGAPIANARVSFNGAGHLASVTSAQRGEFRAENIRAGTYAVSVSAKGYSDLTGRTIDVRSGVTTSLALILSRSTTSLLTVGSVQTRGGDAISTTSASISLINPQTYAVQGYTQISDVLQNDVAATLVHPLGGSVTSLPTSVALRGPDPTETLVAIDGHPINNGNTGDFDLSLLDPADYGNIELIKGISPSALVGPNTIDGAINLRTIEPTVMPQAQARFSAGSYGSYFETLQTTGSDGRLGYAASAHQTWTNGQVNQTVIDANSGMVQQVGSAVEGSTLLGMLRYAIGNSGAFAAFTLHDQSLFRDLSAGLSSVPAPSGASGGDAALRHPSDAALATSTSFPELDSFDGRRCGAERELRTRHRRALGESGLFGDHPDDGAPPRFFLVRLTVGFWAGSRHLAVSL